MRQSRNNRAKRLEIRVGVCSKRSHLGEILSDQCASMDVQLVSCLDVYRHIAREIILLMDLCGFLFHLDGAIVGLEYAARDCGQYLDALVCGQAIRSRTLCGADSKTTCIRADFYECSQLPPLS